MSLVNLVGIDVMLMQCFHRIHVAQLILKVQWSSGYDFCLTCLHGHRRSPVRSWTEPVFVVACYDLTVNFSSQYTLKSP